MKISELIYNVDKSDKFKSEVSIYDLAETLNIFDISWTEQTRLVSYFVGNWYCTDTYVGYKVYFLDDKPVAFSTQPSRKSEEKFEWLSKEDYIKVKNYILTFKNNSDEDNISILNLNENIEEYYIIPYYCEIFDYQKPNAYYEYRKCKIINFKDSYNDGTYHPEIVQIQFYDDLSTMWLETNLLRFKFNIIRCDLYKGKDKHKCDSFRFKGLEACNNCQYRII